MDSLLHDLAFPLTVAFVIGAVSLARYWISQTNEQLRKMNQAHQETLGLIAVMRSEAEAHLKMDDLRFAYIERRVNHLERAGDRGDGYA